MRYWSIYVMPAMPIFALVVSSCRVLTPQLSIQRPANYEVIGAPVEGVSCEISDILYPADFGRAIRNAREKVNPPADGLIDVEFWYWKPPVQDDMWLLIRYCVSVTGTPVRLIKGK